MEILKSFLVKYEKTQGNDKLAILMNTSKGYYIKYLKSDGMGWSEYIDKIADDEAEALII